MRDELLPPGVAQVSDLLRAFTISPRGAPMPQSASTWQRTLPAMDGSMDGSFCSSVRSALEQPVAPRPISCAETYIHVGKPSGESEELLLDTRCGSGSELCDACLGVYWAVKLRRWRWMADGSLHSIAKEQPRRHGGYQRQLHAKDRSRLCGQHGGSLSLMRCSRVRRY